MTPVPTATAEPTPTPVPVSIETPELPPIETPEPPPIVPIEGAEPVEGEQAPVEVVLDTPTAAPVAADEVPGATPVAAPEIRVVEAPAEAVPPTETPVPVDIDAPLSGGDGGVEAANEASGIAPVAGTTPGPVDGSEFPAVIEAPSGETPEEPAPVEPDAPVIGPAPAPGALTFDASSWDGGVLVTAGWYGRPAVAIYGQETGESRAALAVELADVPAGGIQLTLTGLGDEWGTAFPFVVEVNGVEVGRYAGAFPNWNATEHGEQGEDAVWGAATVDVPADLLRTGTNEIAVVGLASGATVGQPPYLLLGEATVAFFGGAAAEAVVAEAPAEDDGRNSGRGGGDGGGEGDDGEGGGEGRGEGRRDRRDRDEDR